jgi:adenylate cyclase
MRNKPPLLDELKRRNVIRMAGLYLVGAWLLTQVASTVLPTFDVPSWALRGLIITLALGFIPALIFSWIFELTPQGLKRDEDVRPEQSIAPQTARRMDRMIIVVLVLALGYFAFDKFVLASRREVSRGKPTPNEHNSIAGAKSIAVLPFVNMTAEKENEFFADGLSEEILNSLARVDGMLVVGRTSSFQFKGKDVDLRTIGQRLGVANVLEGSVRRAGQRARITAQLIRASDGIHLWSETYDRTLTDTLAVQLDIAEQVAAVLDVVLDDKQRASMRAAGVKNVDAFIAFQKGLKLYADAHNPATSHNAIEGLRLANKEFDKAISLEPTFSQALFAAADLYDHILLADHRSQAERIDAQAQGLHYYELAAANSHDEQQRLLTLADRQLISDDWRGLATNIEAALRAPGCSATDWLPVFASVFGYGDLIEDLGARVSVCDPLNVVNYNSRVRAALTAGKPQRALDILAAGEKAAGGAPVASSFRVQALVMSGRIDDAKTELAKLTLTNENYYKAALLVGLAAGESRASIHERLRAVDRTKSIYDFWEMADVVAAAVFGDRAEANRLAAAIDARPGGGLILAVITGDCLCGAPFDLEATSHFKARLAESGLPWPPAPAMKFPARVTPLKP